MSTYSNNSLKTVLIEKTGAEIIAAGYEVDISSLLDSSSDLASALSNQDEIIVIRKFDSSGLASDITADEAWSAYTLPNQTTSGSAMYSILGNTISFASGSFTWTAEMSGRAADTTLPAISATDKVYIVRKVILSNALVTFTPSSKISSEVLNIGLQQLLNQNQEMFEYFIKTHKLNPTVGRPNGLVPLNASGKIASTYVDGNTINLQTGNGLSGNGTVSTPLVVSLSGDSLVFDGTNLKADTQDVATSTSSTKPLSARQGKLLQDQITSLGSGVVYKGAFDVRSTTVAAAGLGTLAAGFTVGVTDSGTADASWGVGSVSSGNLLRYSGSAWQVASATNPLLADGSVALAAGVTLDLTAGTATVATQSAADSSTKAASTAFVQQEISGTIFTELNDVDTNADDTTGNFVVWDSNSWAPVRLETVDLTKQVLSTGSNLNAVANVNAPSPNNGDSLVYQSSSARWEPQAITSTATDTILAGTGDGSANDYSELNNAFSSANLGYNATTPPSSSTVSFVNLTGRRFATQTGLTIGAKKQFRVENGTIELDINNGIDSTLLGPGTLTSAATTISVEEERTSTVRVADASVFNEGDMVRIIGKDVYDFGKEDAQTDRRFAAYHIAKIVKIETNTTNEDTIELDDPLPTRFVVNSVVTRDGEGTNGQDQMENVVFENLTFTDQHSKVFYLNKNDNTAGTTPLAVNAGQDDVTINVPNAHGVLAGAGVLVQDADLGGDGVNHIIPRSGDINRWMTIDSINTAGTPHEFVCNNALGNNIIGGTGNYGGDQVWLVISKHNGVHLRNASNIRFKNCRFEKFNGEFAVKLENCKDVIFENCTFSDCLGQNYYNQNESHAALKIQGSVGIKCIDCKFKRCTQAVYVCGGTQTVDSVSVKYSSGDLSFIDCEFNASVGISSVSYVSNDFEPTANDHFVHGLFKCVGCNFIPFNPNPQRALVRYHSGPDYSDSSYVREAINLLGQYAHIHSNNIGVAKETEETLDKTAFWGNGKGHTDVEFENNPSINKGNRQLVAGFYEGITFLSHPNPYGSGLHQRAERSGQLDNINTIRIAENNVNAVYTGIVLQVYTTKEGFNHATNNNRDSRPMPAINIASNYVTGSLYGIQIRNGSFGVNSTIVWGATIHGNFVRNNWWYREYPGAFVGATGEGSGDPQPYTSQWSNLNTVGIWLREIKANSTQKGIEFRCGKLQDNQCHTGRVDTGRSPLGNFITAAYVVGRFTTTDTNNIQSGVVGVLMKEFVMQGNHGYFHTAVFFGDAVNNANTNCPFEACHQIFNSGTDYSHFRLGCFETLDAASGISLRNRVVSNVGSV